MKKLITFLLIVMMLSINVFADEDLYPTFIYRLKYHIELSNGNTQAPMYVISEQPITWNTSGARQMLYNPSGSDYKILTEAGSIYEENNLLIITDVNAMGGTNNIIITESTHNILYNGLSTVFFQHRLYRDSNRR